MRNQHRRRQLLYCNQSFSRFGNHFDDRPKRLTYRQIPPNMFYLSLNLPPRSHIDLFHFRKINWLPVSDRAEYCIANTVFKYWNGIVPGYIHEMFKPSLCRYSTRSQMALDIPLRKTNTGQRGLSFLGPKIWSKIGLSIKNVRTSPSFVHAIKKNILLHLQN